MPRSKPESALYDILVKLFPNDRIVEQYPVKVAGKTLFVDFVIMDKGLAFETDGRQHDEFVAHFHKDADAFKASKERDRLKELVLRSLGYTLVRIKHDEKLTVATVRSKLLAALR